jgi:hypothetical protein
MLDPITSYIAELQRNFRAGIATEHTYRPGLKAFIEALGSGITAFNDPKRVECGAPDFTVARDTKHGPFTIGYIEAKDIATDLEGIERDATRKNPTTQNGEQLKRYLTLPNLILTDYLEFRWYVDGQRRMIARLARPIKADWLEKERDGGEGVAQLIGHFLDHEPPPIAKPRDLALRMARLTHRIRDMIVTAFESGRASDMLRDLHKAFEETLIPDLSIPNFADMYAQTLAYGLFAARVNHGGPQPFRRLGAAAEIPKTNPFLRRLFDTITGAALGDEPYVGFVDDLAQLLHCAGMPAVLADFGKRGVRQDPVLHFYETFLAAYDPDIREMRGVYYTPEPVVSYIVRSLDYLLRTRFGCPEGLADASTIRYVRHDEEGEEREESCHRVLILDPACGTGTFLYTVVDLIRGEFVRRGNAGMWSAYVREHLLPRLFGFELMMAPYAMAHLKLGMQLGALDMPEAERADWACDLTGERLGVYLTNTLEEAIRKSEVMMASFISDEANAAVRVKRELPILVVLGNPPYSKSSANKGQWIERLMETYKRTVRAEETQIQALSDDYAKFIRFAHARIEQTGQGMIGLVTNHAFLDGPLFRDMRKALMDAFSEIYILQLHGDSRKQEVAPAGVKDENVFDIQQGVAISLFVRQSASERAASVRHAELWGTRRSKYAWLSENDVSSTRWTDLTPEGPSYLFVPVRFELREEYDCWPRLVDLFGTGNIQRDAHVAYGAGFVTQQDSFAIAHHPQTLLDNVEAFLDPRNSRELLQERFRFCTTNQWDFDKARKELGKLDLKSLLTPCLYRPFDVRFTLYDKHVATILRSPIMRHLFRDNLALLSTRRVTRPHFTNVFASRQIVEYKAVSHDRNTFVFPLYLYPEQGALGPEEGRRVNLNPAGVRQLEKLVGLAFVADRGDLASTFGPEDVFHYVYAVLHSPIYRARYVESLQMDFPRIPLTTDVSLFRTLCSLGAELVALHLMESPLLDNLITSYPIPGDDIVEKVTYRAPGEPEPGSGKPLEKGRVYISEGKPKEGKAGQYFDGVPPEVWNFHLGGYQVCEKWLKDRKGRVLSYDDRIRYQKIVVALQETIRLMGEIDRAIPSWPLQ